MKHDVTGYDFGSMRHLAFWIVFLSIFSSLAADESPSKIDEDANAWKAELAQRSRWWSLQAPKKAIPPKVSKPMWNREPVDRFIFTKLSEAKLLPAKPAEAEVLLRRLSFVLTGLPPKQDEIIPFRKVFQKNPDKALENLVDQLLNSPQFGEHFSRHWMDVVRYTDTYGYEWDIPAKGSWEYRDYLIRSFNDDIGYDQLIREQIAGDLLAEPRINEKAGVNESMIGPMFYHLGEHRHGASLNFNGVHQEMVNNKIDAFSKAFLAMTVACARCHDHKLDAISQADYYALAGVFMTPRWRPRIIDSPGKYDDQIDGLKKLRKEIRNGLAKIWSKSGGFQAPELKNRAKENQASMKDAKPGDIEYPIIRLLESTNENVVKNWKKGFDEWRDARKAALKNNKEKFNLLSQFPEPGFPEGWATEGDGLKYGYVENGAPLISLGGEKLIDHLLPRGYHTHALSSKLPGSLRLPEQEKTPGKFVSLRIQGGDWAGTQEIPQNAFLSEYIAFFNSDSPPKWRAFSDRNLVNGVTRVLAEVSTASLHPNFPPRTGLSRAGKLVLKKEDVGRKKRSWFSLTGIVSHDSGGSPVDTLSAFTALYGNDDPPHTVDEAWQRISDWLSASVKEWSAGSGDVEAMNWLLKNGFLANDAKEAPEVATLVQKYREVEAMIDFPRSANGMDEREVTAIDYRLNVRGNVYEDGPAIRRNFLEVFAGKHQVNAGKGSGRLELADYLSSKKNPQTARVYVNRIWGWVFGTGIVATPNDFGKLGFRPTHPELLDWLATQFMEEGWSTKKMIRRLVLSRTFLQSGEVIPLAVERDPDNVLLHHYPTRRLEAEAIRDNLLAVSGRLDQALYGPPIKPPRKVEDAAKRLFSGPLDSEGRRSIYMEMSIMQPPEFLVGFDLPDLKLPTGRRNVTNVPTQALIMLNDPFVIAMADHWAERLKKRIAGKNELIREMFLTAFGREPSEAESKRWIRELEEASLADVAHTFFNAKEFIFYR